MMGGESEVERVLTRNHGDGVGGTDLGRGRVDGGQDHEPPGAGEAAEEGDDGLGHDAVYDVEG